MEKKIETQSVRLLPSKKGKLTLGRFLIPYRIYGKSGPFLVCVNGAQQTMASWQSAVPRFSDSFRILLYDAPGQARGSILSGSAAVDADEQVLALHNLIAEIMKPREIVHMVGASWGAVIAAVYAARYPDQVRFLLLASFGFRPSSKMLKVIQKARKLFDMKKNRDGAQLIIDMFGQRLAEENKRKMIRQFQSMSEEQFDSVYEHLKVMALSGHLSDYVDLRKVRAKTVIVNGEDDQLLDNNDLREAARLIPHAELRIIPDAGHFLHLEREGILDIYAEYLNANGSQ